MERIYKTLRGWRTDKDKITKLVVYPTFLCNLNCKYCFYKKNDSQTLSVLDFKRALLEFIKISQKHEVIFLGGEPTILKELKEYINEIKKLKKDIRITLFTNATLIDDKISKVLRNNKINLVVSIDGDNKTNDLYRKFKNTDRSVYNNIISNLRKYKLIKNTTVNMVIRKKTLKKLCKNIIYLNKLGFNSIGFNIDYSDNWEKSDLAEIKKQIDNIFEYHRVIIKKNRTFKFSNIYEIFELIKNNTTPQCSNLILLPDGKFYLCDKIATAPQNIREKFIIKKDIRLERNLFFKKMKNMNLTNSHLFCKIGLYLYFRYIKRYKHNIMKKRIKTMFYLQENIKKHITRHIKQLIYNKS